MENKNLIPIMFLIAVVTLLLLTTPTILKNKKEKEQNQTNTITINTQRINTLETIKDIELNQIKSLGESITIQQEKIDNLYKLQYEQAQKENNQKQIITAYCTATENTTNQIITLQCKRNTNNPQ